MYNFSTYTEDTIVYLPVSEIRLNPYQPRRFINPKYLQALTKSIRAFGILQPIAVRFKDNKYYELIFGECRLKAAQSLGFEHIPTIIMSVSDRDAAVLSLLENTKRENLSYIEEADAIMGIKTDFCCTEKALSHLLSEDIGYINGKLALNALTRKTKSQLIENNLSEDYAKAVQEIKDEKEQSEVIHKINKYGLNLKRTRNLIQNTIAMRKSETLFNLNQRKKSFDDVKVFFTTVKQAVDMLKSYGMTTEYHINKEKDFYEVVIRLDK